MERDVFVIRNQDNFYLAKSGKWLSGKDSQSLYRTEHHDEALNTLLEINAKDILLRGKILAVIEIDKGKLDIEVDEEAEKKEIEEKKQQLLMQSQLKEENEEDIQSEQ